MAGGRRGVTGGVVRNRRRGARATACAAVFAAAAGGALAAPNDPHFTKQWALADIAAEPAWTRSTGERVVVAVVDSGVDDEHPDLAGKLVPGYDFYSDDPDTDADDSSHGTSVAGFIAAATGNGIGIAGTAPDAKIMPVKVFGRGSNNARIVASIPRAIDYAVRNGAKVVNLSLGGIQGLSLVGLIETPCKAAYEQGALCVVSAGNDGSNHASGYDHDLWAILVSAHDRSGSQAGFAQPADTKWGLTAPGAGLFGLVRTEERSYADGLAGTSFSAPHVSGVAAMLFAQGATPTQVLERLRDSSRGVGPWAGWGKLDAAGALQADRPAPSSGGSAGSNGTGAVGPRGAAPHGATRVEAGAAAGATTTVPAAQSDAVPAGGPAAGGGDAGEQAGAPPGAAPRKDEEQPRPTLLQRLGGGTLALAATALGLVGAAAAAIPGVDRRRRDAEWAEARARSRLGSR